MSCSVNNVHRSKMMIYCTAHNHMSILLSLLKSYWQEYYIGHNSLTV